MKKTLKALLAGCAMLAGIGSVKSQSLFTYVSDLSSGFTSTELLKLDSLRQNPVYDSAVIVQVNNLWTIQNNGSIVVNLPGSSVNQVKMQRVQLTNRTNPEEGYVWDGSFYGQALNDANQTEPAIKGLVNLIKKSSKIYGHLQDFEGTKEYNLISFGSGKNVLLRYSEPYFTAHRACASINTLTPAAKSTSAGPCAPIDVLVLYTPDAVGGVNIDDEIDKAMQLLDGATYNTLGSTNAYVKFNLAGKRLLQTYEYNPGKTDIRLDVTALGNNTTVQYYRDLYKADLVVCITGNHYGNKLGEVKAIGMSIHDAYAIVTKDAMTAKFTFMHEVGHLMSGRHQRYDDFKYSGFEDDNTTGYAHGYGINKGGKRHNDIMHFLVDGNKREHAFSSPDIQIRGKNFGTASDNDMGRTLVENGCTASEYRTGFAFFDANIASTPHRTVGTGTTVSLMSIPISGYANYSYQWWVSYDGGANYTAIGTNTSMPGVGTSSFVMPAVPYAVVCLKATDAVSQTKWIYKTIFNISMFSPGPYIDHSAPPPFKSTTGIRPVNDAKGQLLVTPNPANSQVQIVANIPMQNQKSILYIVNIMGKEIARKEIQGEEKAWDFNASELPSGTYFVRLMGNAIDVTEKLIIAK